MLPPIVSSPASAYPALPKTPAVPQGAVVEVRAEVQATRVEISGGSVSYSHRSLGVEAYAAIDEQAAPRNPFADTVLRFIDAQLQRDLAEGATQEELQSRLQAGLDGFLAGYGQAFEQLSASGMLDDGVRQEIEGTRTQVLAGIQDLAEELGVEVELPEISSEAAVPVMAPITAPAAGGSNSVAVQPGKALLSAVLRDVQIIEQYQKAAQKMPTYEHLGRPRAAATGETFAYGVRESRDFSLKLHTADGDAVTIRMNNSQTGVSQFTRGAGAAGLAVEGEQLSGFSFAVEGALDEGELQALTDLLGQVGDISAQFYGGNLDRAFELASDMTFDTGEIADFRISLHMQRTEVAQVERREVPGPLAALEQFSASVQQAGEAAEHLQQPRSLVADLLDWVARSTRPQDPRSAFLGPAARAFL